MQENNALQTDKVKDRVLGDEWLGWDGRTENYEGVLNEKKRVFLWLAVLVFIVLSLSGWLLWYLISPRLREFHRLLPLSAAAVLILIVSISLIQLIFLRKGILFFLLPLTFKLGRRFGLSRDRIANSFIKVNNIQSRVFIGKGKLDRLLILLPRCLESGVRQAIARFKQDYSPCEFFVATGGDAARQIIKKNKPSAIIAVACERDLVSGMKDVSQTIPVIAIPNKRPEGPCKNTLIDVAELEDAIKLCLGMNG